MSAKFENSDTAETHPASDSSKGYAFVREQLRELRQYTPSLGTQSALPELLLTVCQALESILESPERLLVELEAAPHHPDGRLIRPEELRVIAQKGLADALWHKHVTYEQVVWAFTRPAALRRLMLTRGDAALAAGPPPPSPEGLIASLPDVIPPLAGRETPELSSTAGSSKRGQIARPSEHGRPLATALLGLWRSSLGHYSLVLVVALATYACSISLAWHASSAKARAEGRIQLEEMTREAQDKKAEAEAAVQALRYQKEIADAEVEKYRTTAESTAAQEQGFKIGSFREKLQRATSYRLQTYEGQPGRLGLWFGPNLGLPYFMGLQVLWTEDSEAERIYEAGRIPLEPVYTHSYQLPPGERRVTLVLRFHTTGETMRKAGVGPVVEEKIPLILSEDGVRIPSAKEQQLVLASIARPKEGQEVGPVFLLDLVLQRPAQAQPGKSTRMIHVLIRALDGCQKCQEEYSVVPFRQEVDDLPDREKHYQVFVSLRSVLASVPAGEKVPTRFEVLVVDLPYELQTWTVAKSRMKLEGPEAVGEVRFHRRVILKPDKADE